MVRLKQVLAVVLVFGIVLATSPVSAQDAQQQQPANLSPQEIDNLVAPIALYPDALVAQVLAAATYPNEVVEAAQWLKDNSSLQGQALADAVNQQQQWDPSVQALTQFPSVLDNMASNLSWTSALGSAFYNQQADVMASVQRLRAQAKAAGNLKSIVADDGGAAGPADHRHPARESRRLSMYRSITRPWCTACPTILLTTAREPWSRPA